MAKGPFCAFSERTERVIPWAEVVVTAAGLGGLPVKEEREIG